MYRKAMRRWPRGPRASPSCFTGSGDHVTPLALPGRYLVPAHNRDRIQPWPFTTTATPTPS